jgi:hypothetical protein
MRHGWHDVLETSETERGSELRAVRLVDGKIKTMTPSPHCELVSSRTKGMPARAVYLYPASFDTGSHKAWPREEVLG